MVSSSKRPRLHYGSKSRRPHFLAVPSSSSSDAAGPGAEDDDKQPDKPPTGPSAAVDVAASSSSTSAGAMSWFPSSDKIDHSQRPPPLPPNKPTSQKAATMVAEPDPEMIETLMAIVGNVNRATAVRYLKAKHNDVGAAVNALFDNEDISKSENASSWDENAWSTDRDGVTSNEYLHPLGSSAAATRPNSPASSMARQNLNPSSKTEEDEDLAKALEMSQSDLRGVSGQEMGRIGANGQETRFGPATKQDYDDRQWAVVPFSMQDNTDEVVPDLDAVDRVNKAGQPRLLKHLPDGDYLSAFLTICHSIGGAREAMLMRDHLQTNYGQDADWWRGQPISLPKIVHISDGTPAAPEQDPADGLIAEVQRVISFLSNSERSYASVGSLTQTDAIKNASPASTRSKTLLELFIQSWTRAASIKSDDAETFRRLFTTTVGTNAPDGMDTPDMNLVDLPVTIGEGEKSDLLERLDDLLWDADGDNLTSDNFIEQPADVVVVRAYQQSAAETQLRLEVPSYFYIDKYMAHNVEATRATRVQMLKGKKRIAAIEEIEKKLQTWKHPRKNTTLDAKRLLTHTLGHYNGHNRAALLAVDKSYNPTPEDEAEYKPPPHYSQIATKLEKVIASIESKLVELTNQKDNIRQAIADLSRSPPPGIRSDDLKHRYTLRGVATKPNITYLLAPTDPGSDDMDLLDDAENTTPPGMQWWRMEYEVNSMGSNAKISKTPTADYDVLRAVELEHRSALLVYASDAIQLPIRDNLPLPSPLQVFVDQDNASFQQELATERAQPPSYGIDTLANDGVRPSIEMGARRSSLDSLRAEGGRTPSPPPSLQYPDYAAAYGGLPRSTRAGTGGVAGGLDDEQDELPVHEILLPEDEGIGMDISEPAHVPFTPSSAPAGSSSRDAVMVDEVQETAAGQDLGLGGAVHADTASSPAVKRERTD